MQLSPSAKQTAPGASSPRAVAEQLTALLRTLLVDPRSDHYGAIERHGLSISQVRALSMLAVATEPQPAGALAERLGLSPAATSRALDGLVGEGLVSRRECSDDRRVRLLEISARGAEVADELVALKTADIERVVADLSPDQRELLATALDSLPLVELGGSAR